MIVLRPHEAGIGDQLLYSTLPELWVRERGEEVYLNRDFRNQGVYDFCWRHNPYIAGFTSEAPTYTLIEGKPFFELLIKYDTNIEAIEAQCGFTPKNRYPKVYFEPGYDPAWRDKVVVEPSYITVPHDKRTVEPYLNWIAQWGVYERSQMVLLEPPDVNGRQGQYDHDIFPDIPRYKPADIYETARIINSCKYFATTESGTAAMASAIKGDRPWPVVWQIITTHARNIRIWEWSNLKKWTTGGILSNDF